MSDMECVNRERFLADLRRHCRQNGLTYDWNPRRGKGGHGIVTVGERMSTVRAGEITRTMKEVMLKQLGLPKDAF